jgi:hypothetical protein
MGGGEEADGRMSQFVCKQDRSALLFPCSGSSSFFPVHALFCLPPLISLHSLSFHFNSQFVTATPPPPSHLSFFMCACSSLHEEGGCSLALFLRTHLSTYHPHPLAKQAIEITCCVDEDTSGHMCSIIIKPSTGFPSPLQQLFQGDMGSMARSPGQFQK